MSFRGEDGDCGGELREKRLDFYLYFICTPFLGVRRRETQDRQQNKRARLSTSIIKRGES